MKLDNDLFKFDNNGFEDFKRNKFFPSEYCIGKFLGKDVYDFDIKFSIYESSENYIHYNKRLGCYFLCSIAP